MKNNKGFTLLEVLAVLVIIGLLIALIVGVVNNQRQEARDNRRITDMDQWRKALAVYYQNNNNSYPLVLTANMPLADSSNTYLAKLPSNPLPRADNTCGNYDYNYVSDGDSYAITYCLADTSTAGQANNGYNLATPAGINGGDNLVGLVGWWKLNEGSGTTVVDSSVGAANSGVINGATWTTGKFSNALSFDGTNKSVSLGSGNLISSTTPFTISFWANLTSISTCAWPVILKSNTDSTNSFIVKFMNSGAYYIGIGELNTTWVPLKTGVVSILSSWKNIIVTYNGSGIGTAANFAVYLNGQAQTLSAMDQADICGSPYSGNNAFNYLGELLYGEVSYAFPVNGKLDDLRVYNRVLSQPEISQIAGQN